MIKDLPSCIVLDKRIERFSGSIRNIFVRSDRTRIDRFVLFIVPERFLNERQGSIKVPFARTSEIAYLFDRYSDIRRRGKILLELDREGSVPFAIFIIYSTGLKRLSRELKWSGGRGRTGHLIPPFRGRLERLKSKLQSFKYTDSQNGLFTFLANNRRI